MLDSYQVGDMRFPPRMDFDGLARFVREVRKRKGFGQIDIRNRGGPSTGWLGDLEAGTMTTNPKIETLLKLAQALGES